MHWLIPHKPEIQGNVTKAFSMFGSQNPEDRQKAGQILSTAMYDLSLILGINLKAFLILVLQPPPIEN